MDGDQTQRFTKSVLCSGETQSTVATKLSQTFNIESKLNGGGEILTKKQLPSNDHLQKNELSKMTDGNYMTLRPDDPIK